MTNPCLRCRRVPDPRACENKDCTVWQSWFIQKWDAMRRRTRVKMEQVQPQPEGTVIGGIHYALPHRVSHYLRTDPCTACICPKELCRTPCPVKENWRRTREEILL